MKKLILLVLILMFAAICAGCGNTQAQATPAPAAETVINDETPLLTQEQDPVNAPDAEKSELEENSSTVLVVYFSATGTTRGVAEKIAALTDADLVEIIPAQPYTAEDLNYNDRTTRATVEQNTPDVRPEIANDISLDGYTMVYLGYPIWWGQAPRIMSTFVESHDFTGITVIPFCTSGSSDIGQSDDTLLSWINETGGATMDKTLTLVIGDTEVSVVWEENASVEALAEMVKTEPLTVQLSMYGGFEQVGPLGTSLPRDDVQTTTQTGDIVLYSGNQIVVFYGSNSWAYTRLGRITDKTADEMKALLGNGDVTITLAWK